jgi:hypothetical protein
LDAPYQWEEKELVEMVENNLPFFILDAPDENSYRIVGIKYFDALERRERLISSWKGKRNPKPASVRKHAEKVAMLDEYLAILVRNMDGRIYAKIREIEDAAGKAARAKKLFLETLQGPVQPVYGSSGSDSSDFMEDLLD